MYKYIWQYYVKVEFIEEFEKIYGLEGAWVQLFKKGTGYKGTELLHDCSNERRFLTIDSWISKSAFDKFRKEFAAEFKELDKICEALTEDEIFLGAFDYATESLTATGTKRNNN